MARRLAQTAGLLAASSLAACSHATTHTIPATQPRGWTATTITNTGSPITITHPLTWRLVKAESFSAGPSQVAAYFTNGPTVTQCHAIHTRETSGFECHRPVERLEPGQVLITVLGTYLLPTNFTLPTNTTVDGHPAMITSVQGPADCPPGTAGEQTLNVVLNRTAPAPTTERWSLFVDACIGGVAGNGDMANDARPAVDVATMLRSITTP